MRCKRSVRAVLFLSAIIPVLRKTPCCVSSPQEEEEEGAAASTDPGGEVITKATPTTGDVADEGGGAEAMGDAGLVNGEGEDEEEEEEEEEEEGEEGEEIWQRRRSMQASGGVSQEEEAGPLVMGGSVDSGEQSAAETDGESGESWQPSFPV